jgi:hypothetical protein
MVLQHGSTESVATIKVASTKTGWFHNINFITGAVYSVGFGVYVNVQDKMMFHENTGGLALRQPPVTVCQADR